MSPGPRFRPSIQLELLIIKEHDVLMTVEMNHAAHHGITNALRLIAYDTGFQTKVNDFHQIHQSHGLTDSTFAMPLNMAPSAPAAQTATHALLLASASLCCQVVNDVDDISVPETPSLIVVQIMKGSC